MWPCLEWLEHEAAVYSGRKEEEVSQRQVQPSKVVTVFFQVGSMAFKRALQASGQALKTQVYGHCTFKPQ